MLMNEVTQCPHCREGLTISPDEHGVEVTCPHCHHVFLVPLGERTDVPNHVTLSILVTLFCGVVGGIFGLIYSILAKRKKARGDYVGALRDAKTAETWCWLSMSVFIIVFALALISQLSRCRLILRGLIQTVF